MVKLLRYQIFLVYGAVFLAAWWMLLSRLPSSSSAGGEDDDEGEQTVGSSTAETILIRFLPVWTILLLGVYAASSVIYGVITFKDTPEASAELDRQINEAKQEMTKRGVIKPGDGDDGSSKKDKWINNNLVWDQCEEIYLISNWRRRKDLGMMNSAKKKNCWLSKMNLEFSNFDR